MGFFRDRRGLWTALGGGDLLSAGLRAGLGVRGALPFRGEPARGGGYPPGGPRDPYARPHPPAPSRGSGDGALPGAGVGGLRHRRGAPPRHRAASPGKSGLPGGGPGGRLHRRRGPGGGEPGGSPSGRGPRSGPPSGRSAPGFLVPPISGDPDSLEAPPLRGTDPSGGSEPGQRRGAGGPSRGGAQDRRGHRGRPGGPGPLPSPGGSSPGEGHRPQETGADAALPGSGSLTHVPPGPSPRPGDPRRLGDRPGLGSAGSLPGDRLGGGGALRPGAAPVGPGGPSRSGIPAPGDPGTAALLGGELGGWPEG